MKTEQGSTDMSGLNTPAGWTRNDKVWRFIEPGTARTVARTSSRTLTPNEVAGWLGCTRQHLYIMLESGAIPGAKKLAGRWFIPREPLEAWLRGEAGAWQRGEAEARE